jgi:hypothetical protein
MSHTDVVELLGKLAQMVQHLWCQFTSSVGSYVHLNDGIEQLVNLLEHIYTLLLVLLDCLSVVGQST